MLRHDIRARRSVNVEIERVPKNLGDRFDIC
jgi:hypothetical protein